MLDEREFRCGWIFTATCLVIIVGFIVCKVAGFSGGLTWHALVASNIINHADGILGDSFVRAGEFSLLSGGDLIVLDVCLVHEVLADGDVAAFKIVSIGNDPLLPRGRLLDVAIHGECVLYLSCIFKDAGGRTSNQEQMSELGVDRGDGVVIR